MDGDTVTVIDTVPADSVSATHTGRPPAGDEMLPGMGHLGAPDRGDVPAAVVRAVDPTLTPTAATVALFWSKVIKTDRCWFWTGAISAPDGYGRLNFQRDNTQRTILAHRFAVMLAHGELPDGVVCEHKCNQPLCVRVDPGHLVPSTQTENIRYAVASGRLTGNRPTTGSGRLRYQRSLDLRAALLAGADPAQFSPPAPVLDRKQDTLF